MTDTQLISNFKKLEKILKETEIYTKKIDLIKEGINPSIYEEDEESVNKCIDKIGKNEKSSHLSSNSKYSGQSTSSNSSSSSDEDTDNNGGGSSGSSKKIGQKRKSKEVATPLSKNKRTKQPSTESPKHEEKEKEKEKETNSNNNSNNGNGKDKESHTINGSTTTSTPSSSSSTISSGQLVAARDSKSNQWILAKVNSFSAKTQKYEVIDEDEDEPKRFSVGNKDIIQLPTASTLPSNTFPINTKVLAMFPDTTAFYPALVVNVQKAKNKPPFYTLHFDDDQENGQTPNRRVSAQYVISYVK
eukprot:gene8039-9887_t